MLRAFRLAYFSVGNSDPNPPVGAVLFDEEDGRILGEGFTQKTGGPHAEVMAVMQAEQRVDLSARKKLVLVVTLEPCSHYGKTPPCASLIISKKISKVVFALRDDSPQVRNTGETILRNSGVEVLYLGKDGFEIPYQLTLAPFFHRIQTKRSYLIMKWAETAKGSLAPGKGPSGRISSSAGIEAVMRLREKYKATLASPGSVRDDKPKLTHRYEGLIQFGTGQRTEFGYFLDSVSFRESMHPTWSIYKNPLRLFWMPHSFSETEVREFILFQESLGGNFICFSPKAPPNNMEFSEHSPVYLGNCDHLDAILQQTALRGFDRVMLEAGPSLSQYILENNRARMIIRIKSNTTPHWDGPHSRKIRNTISSWEGYHKSHQEILPLPEDSILITYPNLT